MAAFVPALTLSMELAMGLRDRRGTVNAVLAIVVAAYLVSFLVSRILEHSSRRMVKTYDLRTDDDCKRASMKVTTEPSCWLAVFLFALGLGLIPLGTDNAPYFDAFVASSCTAKPMLCAASGDKARSGPSTSSCPCLLENGAKCWSISSRKEAPDHSPLTSRSCDAAIPCRRRPKSC